MKLIKILLSGATALSLAACDVTGEGGNGRVDTDKTVDYGQGNREKSLTQLVAGVWVDPTGCDHWIIDDGVEGYLSARLDKYGKPVCSGVAQSTYTAGDFKGGSRVRDPN